ncbi:hypothetical protein VZQ01_20440 [Myxococcus faecalis]|uniref:hypothetical protein n=1 Tax=Myxococcus faecalis TaxID=3115646 RepID=UPI003CF67CDE
MEHHARTANRLLFLLCVIFSSGAFARPFDFFAIYEPTAGSSSAKVIRLKLNENALLPDGGEGYALDRLIVQFEPDGVSMSATSIFNRLRFTVDLGSQQTTTVVRTEDIAKLPEREHTLVRWRGDDQPDAVVAVKISLQAIYSSDFLCMQEMELFHHAKPGQAEMGSGWPMTPPRPSTVRRNTAKPPGTDKNNDTAKTPGTDKNNDTAKTPGTDKNNDTAEGDDTANDEDPDKNELKNRRWILTQGGVPILFSYCKTSKGTNTNTLIDWRKAYEMSKQEAKATTSSNQEPSATSSEPLTFLMGDPDKVKNADRLREAHKRALSDRIVEQLNDRFSSFGRTVVTDTDEPSYDNVLVQVASTFKFSVIKSAGSLMLIEESGGTVERLANLIDQDSDVSLSLDRPTCLQLPPAALMNNPWVFELEVPDGKDGKTRRAKTDLDFHHGCNRMIMVPWKDFLNQRVTFRVIYRVLGNEDLVVFKDSFWVYNLGLITTLPVVTEIVAAAQKASAADVEATSSIPVSFAFPVNDKKLRNVAVAVTFPFTLSVNTRDYPKLADYVALAPSVSVIGGGTTPLDEANEPPPTTKDEEKDQGPNSRVGIGVGVNLFRAFYFGYTWAPSDGGRYVLVGISVPELLPLFKKAL